MISTPRKRATTNPRAERLITLLSATRPDDQPDADAVTSLLREAQGGKPAAFGRLFDLYSDVVFRYVFYRTGHRVVAEEVTTDIFQSALKRILRAGKDGQSFVVWLFLIAKEKLRAYHDSDKYCIVLETGNTEEATETLLATQQLPPAQQELLVLFVILHLDIPEIAAIMGRDTGNVENLLMSAAEALAAIMGDLA